VILASSPTLGQAPYWYLTRSTGITGFVLLTVAMAFGVAATQRSLASPAWPRFATQDLHRNVSLLGLAFIAVHIVTTLVDGYVTISWWNVLVPYLSSYRRPWVALGTVSFDLLLLVIATSLARLRMRARTWRLVHWTVYLMWPLSWLHFVKTGTDAAHGRFGIWVAVVSAGVVGMSVAVRVMTQDAPSPLKSIPR
jgi:sulfoxide reductase heme-binding subunit YedZ